MLSGNECVYGGEEVKEFPRQAINKITPNIPVPVFFRAKKLGKNWL